VKVIWKFGLDIGPAGRCTLPMPRIRECLSVGLQANRVVLWAKVDPDQGYEDAAFIIVGTGWDAPDGKHCGTVQTGDGFVWHVFEVVSDGD
jgi:hypothetical protein